MTLSARRGRTPARKRRPGSRTNRRRAPRGCRSTSGEYAQHMPLEISGRCPRAPSAATRPGRPAQYLQDGFAARTAVAEKLPVGALSMDLRESSPLVMTVIHSSRSGSSAAGPAKPASSQVRSARRSGLESTRSNFRSWSRGPRARAAVSPAGRERQVGSPGVLTRDAPSGLAVSNQIDINTVSHGATLVV